MHAQSTKTPRSTRPPRQPCTAEHDWRLSGIVRTAKGQVDYYQCRRCLAPRRDQRPARVQQDRA